MLDRYKGKFRSHVKFWILLSWHDLWLLQDLLLNPYIQGQSRAQKSFTSFASQDRRSEVFLDLAKPFIMAGFGIGRQS